MCSTAYGSCYVGIPFKLWFGFRRAVSHVQMFRLAEVLHCVLAFTYDPLFAFRCSDVSVYYIFCRHHACAT